MPSDLSQETIQVLYEISLAISPRSDVESTIETAVSTYLQKLNCSAAAVLQPLGAPTEGAQREVVTTLPEQYILADIIEETRDRLPETPAEVNAMLPLVDEVESGMHRHVMALPDYGVLLLLKRGPPLAEDITLSLPDVNEKLATACNRVAVQKQYETQYRNLFQEAPVMFVRTQATEDEPVIADWNTRFAKKLGYTDKDLQGRPLAELYAEQSREKLLDGGYTDALENRLGTVERVLRTNNSKEIITKMRATPHYDADGAVLGTRMLFIDVTELKRRKVQVSVLNRVLRHNIRNDLTVIQGRLDMAKAEGDTATHLEDAYEKTEELISSAKKARHIQRLIDNPEVRQHDAGEFVDFMISRARTEFPDATVRADIESGPVPVLASNGLQHALWELIENAGQYAGETPIIEVTMRRDEDTARITIADDGPGISPAEHEVLEAGMESEIEHGSGLGLWLVHWVIDRSGGEVRFEQDNGTVVTVTLPLAERDD